MKTTAQSLTVIPFVITTFAFLSIAEAVVPPPDGGYAGANTAEGTDALLSLTSGIANTAVGASALLQDTTGSYNVGIGSGTLALNISGSLTWRLVRTPSPATLPARTWLSVFEPST
jgi:hypothetical protein